MLDTVIDLHASKKARIGLNGTIVADLNFEAAVVKLQRKLEDSPCAVENKEICHLLHDG